MNVSILAPAGSLYIVLVLDFLRIVAEQLPNPADWAWAMDIVRIWCASDIAERCYFDKDMDIWDFPLRKNGFGLTPST